jgi:hypothetical protein
MEYSSVSWDKPYLEGAGSLERNAEAFPPPHPIVAPVLLVGSGPNPFLLERKAKDIFAPPHTGKQTALGSAWAGQQVGTSINSPVPNNVKLITFIPLRVSWQTLAPKSTRRIAALVYLYDSESTSTSEEEEGVDPLEEFQSFLDAQEPTQFPQRMLICVVRMSGDTPGATTRRLMTQEEVATAVERFFSSRSTTGEARSNEPAQLLRPLPSRSGQVFDLSSPAHPSSMDVSEELAVASQQIRQYLIDELWHRAWWSSCNPSVPRGAVRLPRLGVPPIDEGSTSGTNSAGSEAVPTATSAAPGGGRRGVAEMVKASISSCTIC